MPTQTVPATPLAPIRRPPAASHHRPRAFTPAFTLVELLIVVGIIAVLAGLLLAVRSRASDAAARAKCLSNLHQLGAAMIMYAQENEQAFPFGNPASLAGDRKEDWIHFRAPALNLETKVNGSALAPFVGAKGPGFVALMQCPTDSVDNHRTDPRSGFAYRFSYSMNYLLTSENAPNVGGKWWNRGATPRVTAISKPSEKILLAEENERTINDGTWQPGRYSDPNNRATWSDFDDYLSVRHDNRKAEFQNPNDASIPEKTRRGNVVFVDGHADFVSRKFAHSPQHLAPSDEGTAVVP